LARSKEIALVLSFLGAFAAPARADDAVSQADRFFKEGRRAADHADFATACKDFEESFRLDPGVGTLINIGDCAEHLGDLERAYQNYRTAYARMSESDDRAPRLRSRIESIEQKSGKIVLQLDAAPDGTVATIDGNVVDPKKGPRHVPAGAHVVLVTAVGRRGTRYNVSVAEGEVRSLHATPGDVLEAVLPTTAPEHERTSWTRPAGIVSLGLGVATVWVGSLAGMMAIDRRDVQHVSCNASGCTQAGVDAARDGATWADVSTATFIAGGALVALGATLVVLSLASPKKTITVGLGAPGFIVSGSFR
jgi:hypothetical protein